MTARIHAMAGRIVLYVCYPSSGATLGFLLLQLSGNVN